MRYRRSGIIWPLRQADRCILRRYGNKFEADRARVGRLICQNVVDRLAPQLLKAQHRENERCFSMGNIPHIMMKYA